MRSRTSSKHSTKSTGVEEQSKLKDQPHLSGAYVRSLVKQLSSSRTKDPSNPSSGDGKFEDKSPQDLAKPHEIQKEIQQRQPKKQARRRFHTSRPYQERLLNMAEARREIVAALKFHRASMKKASEQKKQLLPRKELLSLPPISQPTEGSQLEDRFKATVNTTGIPTNHFSNICSFPASFPSHLSLYNSTSPVSVTDFNVVFPKPPLGLNLNISGFENLWTTVTCSSTGSPSLHLTSSSSISTPMTTSSTISSSSSQTCSSCTTISVQEVPLFKPAGVSEATSEPRVESFHLTMDDKEMEEIRFIGEQYDMEWNDKLNSVHSAWWSKFLKTMDNDYQLPEDTEGDSFGQVVDEIGIPPWLSDQECLNSYSSNGERIQDDANLPCLDFGEIEGLYGEWLL